MLLYLVMRDHELAKTKQQFVHRWRSSSYKLSFMKIKNMCIQVCFYKKVLCIFVLNSWGPSSFHNGYLILKEFSSITYLTKYNGIKYASRNLRNKIAFNLVGSKKDCEGHLFTIQGSNSFVIIPKSKINVSTTTYHGAYELNSMRHNFLHSIFRSFSVCYWRNYEVSSEDIFGLW